MRIPPIGPMTAFGMNCVCAWAQRPAQKLPAARHLKNRSPPCARSWRNRWAGSGYFWQGTPRTSCPQRARKASIWPLPMSGCWLTRLPIIIGAGRPIGSMTIPALRSNVFGKQKDSRGGLPRLHTDFRTWTDLRDACRWLNLSTFKDRRQHNASSLKIMSVYPWHYPDYHDYRLSRPLHYRPQGARGMAQPADRRHQGSVAKTQGRSAQNLG